MAFDPWRVALMIGSAVLLAGMLLAAWQLRGTERADGCVCVALFATAVLIGSYQRLSEPPIFATFVSVAAVLKGLQYLVRYAARTHTQGKQP